MIDLRSDTLTLPSAEMRWDLRDAAVGDDYYQEDPTVNRLEDCCCELFRTEAALFVPTGMLANQLAIATQVARGAEFITEYGYHVNLFESAQYASLCHVVLNGWRTADGVLRPSDVEQAIASKPRDAIYAQPQLVSIENTINSRQGKVFPLAVIEALRTLTRDRGLRLHLDGARIFNAHVATAIPLAEYAARVDTLTACFSKSLGAPFGSMLLGPRDVIDRARRLRVWYGAGVHQIGLVARAALFALTRHLPLLAEDHRRTTLLAEQIAACTDLGVRPAEVETNAIFLDFSTRPAAAAEFERQCYARGLRVALFTAGRVRLMVSRNVDDDDIRKAASIIIEVSRCLDGVPERAGMVSGQHA